MITNSAIINRLSKSELQTLLDESSSLKEVLDILGLKCYKGNYKILQQRIEAGNLSLQKLVVNKSNKRKKIAKGFNYTKEIDLTTILVENSLYTNTTLLKKKILQKNLIEEVCDICNMKPVWKGKQLTLQLDHKNGNNRDHRLSNLRFLCPNCHSQTETYCRGLKPKKLKHGIKRKVKERPSKKQLLEDLKTMSFISVGRKYGVTDNSIRNWLKWKTTNNI